MINCGMRSIFLLLVGSIAVQAKLPLDDFNYYFKTGLAPENSTLEWPEYHSSTFTVEVVPLSHTMDAAEVNVFGLSMKQFYERIFDSQSQYSLACRTVDVMQQGMTKDNVLSVQIVVAVNFRPHSDDQILTNEELRRILLHLVNEYDDHLVYYLRGQHMSFKNVAMVSALSLEMGFAVKQKGFVKQNQWYIVALAVASLVILGSLTATYRLYRREFGYGDGLLREWRPSKYSEGRPSGRHSSVPDPDVGNRDTLVLDEDEENDSYESERKYAFRPSENYVDTDSPPASPEPYYVLDARTSRSRPSRLTQDESVLFTALEQEVRRTELWAPPGKLGVAIDVVNGHPVVHSLKAGSALEGFLSKGDRIVQIDEIDTSLMSAADVTSLMVRRMNDRRKIVYIRGDALG